jgi:Mg2+/citrate symporter
MYEIRHIALTAPDSSDRQFVRSVTLITAKEEAGGEASSSLRAESKTQISAEAEMQASLSEQAEAEKKRGPLFWVALIATLAVIAAIIKKIVFSRN